MERVSKDFLYQLLALSFGLPDRDLERKWPQPRILAGERAMMANYSGDKLNGGGCVKISGRPPITRIASGSRAHWVDISS